MIDSSRSDNEHIAPPPKSTIYVTLLQLVGPLALNIECTGGTHLSVARRQDGSNFSDRPRREGLSDRFTPAKSFRDLARQVLVLEPRQRCKPAALSIPAVGEKTRLIAISACPMLYNGRVRDSPNSPAYLVRQVEH